MEKNQDVNTKNKHIADEKMNDDFGNDQLHIQDNNECMMETAFSQQHSELNANVKTIQPIKIDPKSTFASANENIWQSLVPTIEGHFATMKRFINRSIRNGSHYGAYNLPSCSHDNIRSISSSATGDASALVSTAIFGSFNKCEYLPKVSVC